MNIIKSGNQKFVRVCEVDIYQGTCNACGAVFEIEHGELSRGESCGYCTVICPYCHKYHTDYHFKKLRRQTVLASEVKVYDSLHSPTRQITESEYNEIKRKEREQWQQN